MLSLLLTALALTGCNQPPGNGGGGGNGDQPGDAKGVVADPNPTGGEEQAGRGGLGLGQKPDPTPGIGGGRKVEKTADGIPIVRVKLLDDVSSVKITIGGAGGDATLSLNNSAPTKVAMAGRVAQIGRLSAAGPAGAGAGASGAIGGWSIGGVGIPGGLIVLRPASAGGVLTVNGTAYRGSVRLVPMGTSGKFDVVNDVDVESYLKSVVSKELYRDWHPETYRAQAIVARTYAMYEVSTSPVSSAFDVYSDVRSQVYGGVGAETARSADGVAATRGIVAGVGMPGDEHIFKAYFSACCGGVGQSAADAFGDPAIPPLAEKNPGELCKDSPRWTWGPVTLSKGEVTRRIKLWANHRAGSGLGLRPEANMGEVRRVVPTYQNRYGRPVRYEVTDARGTRYSMTSEELRWGINGGGVVSGGQLLSSFVYVKDNGPSFTFTGRGSGHGVGMCQYCAQAMALAGKRHEEIVRWSYSGARLVRAW